MKTKPNTWTIKQVLDLAASKLLTPNPEYQRGQVWTRSQQQMLIDSLMRGFTFLSSTFISSRPQPLMGPTPRTR